MSHIFTKIFIITFPEWVALAHMHIRCFIIKLQKHLQQKIPQTGVLNIEQWCCSYFIARMRICFRLMKDRFILILSETVVTSFVNLMVFINKLFIFISNCINICHFSNKSFWNLSFLKYLKLFIFILRIEDSEFYALAIFISEIIVKDLSS